jgi:Zn-dependent metalloprotease
MLKFLSIATTLLLCGFSPHHHQASAAPAIGVRGAPVIHQISKKLAKATKRVDLIGNSHERFQVTFDDIPVFGMHEIIHQRAADGAIRFKEDPMASSLANASLDTKASVAQAEARSIATIHVSEGHDGTIEVIEDELNIYLEGKTAHLVYKVLCNKFDSNDGLISMPLVFVDAHSGSVVKELETLSSYALSDNDKITYNYDNGNSVGDSSSSILLEIHEHVQDVLDFLNDVCNMDSYDGNGARVKSYGDRDGYVNAYWNGDGFHYGNGNGVRAGPLGVRDIVAHEIGHAITDFSSDLVYHDESGALNEGASDIMGAMLDYYKDGVVTTDTWNIGEDAWLASVALRYMHKPSHDNSSKDHYSDRFTGNGDNGGVHYNSGILNHWFYLLSQGGQHHDSNFRTGTIISGIGIDDAFQIWFQAWTNYLRPNSDYAEAAVETLNACEDLGYDVDTICASIEDAWAEVGVTHYTWCPVDECGPHCGTCCSVSDCEAPEYDCGIAICGADGQCSHDYSGCSGLGLFQLDLKTDDYPAETSWVVKDDCDGGAVVLSFSTGSYTDKVTVHEHLEVLALSRYTFTVEDSAGKCLFRSNG